MPPMLATQSGSFRPLIETVGQTETRFIGPSVSMRRETEPEFERPCAVPRFTNHHGYGIASCANGASEVNSELSF